MKLKRLSAVFAAAALTFTLAACSSDNGGGEQSDSTSDPSGEATESAAQTITLAGWSLTTTPEFQLLVDGFNASQDNYQLEVQEYDATDYDTQLTADLSAGTAPDLYVLKNLKMFYTYQSTGSLLDVSDVVAELPESISGTDPFIVDGLNYAVPYREDGWVLYYNKELFEKAGVDLPDGSWTWDDYSKAAKDLTEKLDGVKGTYMHNWQSLVQAFALAQVPGADFLSGNYDYQKEYYKRALDLQDAGAQVDFGTITTNQLTYQGQFGTQEAAMMPMGSWYVATLLAQQESGEADTFEWGMAPVPQYDASTTGTDKTPVTFGNPTAIGINAAIDESKIEGAREFLKYAGSVELGVELAKIGITPAHTGDEITEATFSIDGIPTDDLSKFALSVREIHPEQPASEYTAEIENILKDMHSEILTGGTSVDDGIKAASEQITKDVLGN